MDHGRRIRKFSRIIANKNYILPVFTEDLVICSMMPVTLRYVMLVVLVVIVTSVPSAETITELPGPRPMVAESVLATAQFEVVC